MRNAAFILVALLLSLPCQAQRLPRRSGRAEPEGDIPALTRKTLPAVGLIVVSDSTGETIAQGSGFIVSPDGKFVTNYHVIEGGASAVIKFPNGAFYAVDGVLAVDRDRDLAVLKASGRDFPFLTLGDSADVQVGETVIAIGSPLSLEATVSSGIVSGVRTIGERNLKVIQTTAAISPGSSGGALLNLKGQVIGVTAYLLQKGENLNFAITTDYLRPLVTSNTVKPFSPTSVETSGVASSQEPAEAPPEPEEGYETCHCAEFSNGVFVFPDPSSGRSLEPINCGEGVGVIGHAGDSLKVDNGKGVVGYVRSRFICKKPTIPADLPREWLNVEGGTTTTVNVRIDGDYLYEESHTPLIVEPLYRQQGSYICDTKREGDQWVGKCHYNWLLEGLISYQCHLTLDEIITSVTARRIEGESQKFDLPSDSNTSRCPTASATRTHFVLIPKD
jgi:Trypsin-like peptidase domain